MSELSPEQAEYLRKDVYGVPSASSPAHLHMVVREKFDSEGFLEHGWFCSCPAFKYGASTPSKPCKHIKSVQVEIERLRAL